jgi:hypothetical protein
VGSAPEGPGQRRIASIAGASNPTRAAIKAPCSAEIPFSSVSAEEFPSPNSARSALDDKP